MLRTMYRQKRTAKLSIFSVFFKEFAYCSNFYAALYMDWIPVFNEVPCVYQQLPN